LVYVYFGQESHYDYLESQGINVSGKIVLARYGATFRANIVMQKIFLKAIRHRNLNLIAIQNFNL
jgi:hypothetical protein